MIQVLRDAVKRYFLFVHAQRTLKMREPQEKQQIFELAVLLHCLNTILHVQKYKYAFLENVHVCVI